MCLKTTSRTNPDFEEFFDLIAMKTRVVRSIKKNELPLQLVSIGKDPLTGRIRQSLPEPIRYKIAKQDD